MSRDIKIRLEHIYKIYGSDAQIPIALDLVKQGEDKASIYSQTECTVGLHDVSLDVRSGEIFVLMGLSGSGKSTLIRLFNRLIEPTEGAIFLEDIDICSLNTKALIELRRTRMSMVFQHFGLLPHKTVLENAAYGLLVAGVPKKKALEHAAETLVLVGLEGDEALYPSQLSGGMQQRVGLARALSADTDILLMDEAFSALDPLIRCELQDQLLELQQKVQKTIIFITHDLNEAIHIGSRIAIIEEGGISQIGTPDEILANPANEHVAKFVQNTTASK